MKDSPPIRRVFKTCKSRCLYVCDYGQNITAGVDYAYTLQGWLKGVNSTAVGDGGWDMGQDGKTGSMNSNIGRDVYGFSLSYFTNDYIPAGAANPFTGISIANNLFNGNIKAMTVNIPKLGEALTYGYQYDQLNRLTAMNAWNGLNNTTNVFTAVSIDDYKEQFSYSPDGSIETLKRYGSGSNVIDSAMWYYYPGTHRLKYINDPAGSHGFDAGAQGANNYSYNEIGEMTGDVERGLTGIHWNVYGKVTQQQLSGGRTIHYTYDANGKRISKQLTGAGAYTEWYVRDATGNVLSIYRETDSLRQTEQYKYGSSLLGVKHHVVNMEADEPLLTDTRVFTAGESEYYLSDHRGNNVVTVKDTRTQHDDNSDGIVDYYTANIVTAQDYSSFGALLEGRQFGTTPRFTYNGKQLDKETGWQYYGMREYLGGEVPVFASVDPITKKYPELTPYQFASNNPIAGIDLDGMEFENYMSSQIVKSHGVGALNIIDYHHGTGPLIKSTYNLQVQGNLESFQKLKEAYMTDPGILHNPNNEWAKYKVLNIAERSSNWGADEIRPAKHVGPLQVGDNMHIQISAMLGIKMNIYVRFTDINVTDNSFSITAATLYGHTDAGTINFSGSIDPNGKITFSIHNETTNNVGSDVLGYGRYAQKSQWKTVLNNVEEYLSGTTISKTVIDEVSIQNAKKGDAVKIKKEDLTTGASSESYKEKQ